MIHRELSDKIIQLRQKFPVVTLTGPRQTGKTTLLKTIYSDLPYVSLEELDNRTFATSDPRGFLSNFQSGAFIDEIQHVPNLFSYIQGLVDSKDVQFALSGSQNFQLIEGITQSLAGRTAILKLLPLTYQEILSSGVEFENFEEAVFKGAYPRIFDKNIEPIDFYPNYITAYIERDVRQIKNIENLALFSDFVKLCAGRIGQVLNIQTLANDAGISPNTAKSWLSVLEASYVIYTIKPHHNNFNKRITKSPKLYFYDTGLACSLLGLTTSNQLVSFYGKGNLFENYVMNEFLKIEFNAGRKSNIYFWQNKTKKEIDILLDSGENIQPFEIKSSKTRNANLFENLLYWSKQAGISSIDLTVVYGGDEDFKTSQGNFLSWRNISNLPIVR